MFHWVCCYHHCLRITKCKYQFFCVVVRNKDVSSIPVSIAIKTNPNYKLKSRETKKTAETLSATKTKQLCNTYRNEL